MSAAGKMSFFRRIKGVSAAVSLSTSVGRRVVTHWKVAKKVILTEPPCFLVARTRRTLALGTRKTIPAADKLRSKFGVKLEILPVPSGTDFGVQMSTEEHARVSRAIDSERPRVSHASYRGSLETAR